MSGIGRVWGRGGLFGPVLFRPVFLIDCNMKKFWWILSLLFGILVFVYGCYGGGDNMQYIGAAFIFAGVIGLFEKIWPEEVER